jgi:hypothetical protein
MRLCFGFLFVFFFSVACASSASSQGSSTAAPTVDVAAIQTQAAAAIFATQTASVPTPTSTFPATKTPKPTETPTPTNTVLPTEIPTVTPTVNIAAEKKTYQSVDVRDLKKSPDKYRDQKIVLRGEVFTIQEENGSTAMQIWVSYPGASAAEREPVVVAYNGTLPALYEKNIVVVYGRGAGTYTGTNALGGQITQPLVRADFVDYGKNLPTAVPLPTKKPVPTVPPLGKDTPTKLSDKWDITYVGEFRDKTVYFYDTGKTAFGMWATVEFRIRNLQSGSTSIGDGYGFVAIDQDGKTYTYDIEATQNARWQYCGCSTLFTEVGPGEETVIVITFDVPETTKTLTLVPTDGAFSQKLLPAPRFAINNFDQVPAYSKK